MLMALLPLAAGPGGRQACPMSNADMSNADMSNADMSNTDMSNTDYRARRVALFIGRMTRRVADIVTECNNAQRRLTQLRLSLDSHVYDARQVPGSYDEFLQRTAGALRHEPSARDRAAGPPCRR
jgi:Pentapeptide repeats (8 copies)